MPFVNQVWKLIGKWILDEVQIYTCKTSAMSTSVYIMNLSCTYLYRIIIILHAL